MSDRNSSMARLVINLGTIAVLFGIGDRAALALDVARTDKFRCTAPPFKALTLLHYRYTISDFDDTQGIDELRISFTALGGSIDPTTFDAGYGVNQTLRNPPTQAEHVEIFLVNGFAYSDPISAQIKTHYYPFDPGPPTAGFQNVALYSLGAEKARKNNVNRTKLAAIGQPQAGATTLALAPMSVPSGRTVDLFQWPTSLSDNSYIGSAASEPDGSVTVNLVRPLNINDVLVGVEDVSGGGEFVEGDIVGIVEVAAVAVPTMPPALLAVLAIAIMIAGGMLSTRRVQPR